RDQQDRGARREEAHRRRQTRAGGRRQPEACPRGLGGKEEEVAADGCARSAARQEMTAARILLAVCFGLVVKGVPVAIPIESSAFSEGGLIPRPYTCDGKDTSPPLSWSGVPEGTKSLALICDDPDASKTFVHWVIFDLPAGTRKLPEGIPPRDEISGGGKQGTN